MKCDLSGDVCFARDLDCLLILVFLSILVLALYVLHQDMLNRRKFALRPGTLSNHNTHLVSFVRFCLYFNLLEFPASGLTLSLYAEFLCRSYSAPGSVLNAISSVKFFHLLWSFDLGGFQDFKFSLTKKAIPRSVRYEPSPALPMTLEVLSKICALCDGLGQNGVAFKALCLVGFHTLARLSSLVPISVVECDLTRTSLISDLCYTQFGFVLTVKWTKSQQFLQEKLKIPFIKRTVHLNICPVVALSKLLLQLPMEGGVRFPLFSWCESAGGKRIQKIFILSTARSYLHLVLSRLGLSDKLFTFHSFRRGGCHLGFIKGAQIRDLKCLGGWSSDAIRAYLPSDNASFRAAEALAGL